MICLTKLFRIFFKRTFYFSHEMLDSLELYLLLCVISMFSVYKKIYKGLAHIIYFFFVFKTLSESEKIFLSEGVVIVGF